MPSEEDKLKAAIEALPAELQEQVRNMVALVTHQQQEIALLRSQLEGFMSVGGPPPSQLAKAFSQAARNTFGKDDAAEAVADLKDNLQKKDQWAGAILKSFRFAKEVAAFLK